MNPGFHDWSAEQRIGDKSMPTVMEKEEAHKLIDRLPPDATWDDLMREIYVREAIERGLADSKAGRTKKVKEVRTKYGLPPFPAAESPNTTLTRFGK
jgi:hypothetical protein